MYRKSLQLWFEPGSHRLQDVWRWRLTFNGFVHYDRSPAIATDEDFYNYHFMFDQELLNDMIDSLCMMMDSQGLAYEIVRKTGAYQIAAYEKIDINALKRLKDQFMREAFSSK
jgi:hypothetical protein